MNQILVTKKLYITPELKKKKKIYKFDFIISIFLVCILTSFYIYAEYDRNKSEETSQQILEDMNQILEENSEEDTTIAKDDILLVVLEDDNKTESSSEQSTSTTTSQNSNNATATTVKKDKRTTASGYTYSTVATISIPKINVNYPIIQGEAGTAEEIEELLKISPSKYWGCEPNEVGNFCIVGHNYRNKKFFSKVPTLVVGDTIDITDFSVPNGRTITYEVYDKYTVDPSDTSCTTQLTGGRKEITLITCTDDSKLRVIVKCKEVK